MYKTKTNMVNNVKNKINNMKINKTGKTNTSVKKEKYRCVVRIVLRRRDPYSKLKNRQVKKVYKEQKR